MSPALPAAGRCIRCRLAAFAYGPDGRGERDRRFSAIWYPSPDVKIDARLLPLLASDFTRCPHLDVKLVGTSTSCTATTWARFKPLTTAPARRWNSLISEMSRPHAKDKALSDCLIGHIGEALSWEVEAPRLPLRKKERPVRSRDQLHNQKARDLGQALERWSTNNQPHPVGDRAAAENV